MGRGNSQASQSPPRGKSCRGHLEDEDDSQGHGRPLPCPSIAKIISLEIKIETCYYPKKMGGGEHGSEDHHRSEGQEGEGIRFCKNAQGIEIQSDSIKRVYLRRNTSRPG